MQSSPPTRAWDRLEPQSPANESQYSLDLGALDLDGQSSTSSPIAKPRVDRVFSEDIDGPSDFTVNMGKWMKGGTHGRGTVRNELGSIKERVRLDDHESDGKDDRYEVLQSPLLHDEDITESHHTPENSPPRESVWGTSVPRETTAGNPDVNEDPGSSEWDPYGHASTPLPPVHKQFLQPTVEDYHSELTPAHLAPSQAPAMAQPDTTLPRGRPTYTRHHSEPSTPGRASSPTLSPVRSPLIRRSVPQPRESSPPTESEIDRRIQQLQAQNEQLNLLNQAMVKALNEEKRDRKQEHAAREAQITEYARRERHSMVTKDELLHKADELQDDVAVQKSYLLSAEAQVQAERRENQRLKELHANELRGMREQMQRKNLERHPQSHALEQDLQLARRARDEAEETAKAHRKELDEYRDSHDAELQRLRLALEDARDAQTALAELKIQLQRSKAEIVSAQSTKQAAEDKAASLQAELSNMKQSQQESTAHDSTERDRAVELAESLQRKLKELEQQTRDAYAEHENAIEQTQSSHARAKQELVEEVDTLRTQHEAQQSQLNNAVLERDEAQDSLAAMQTELETLKADLADKEGVEKEFDAKIADTIKRREAYWRAKLRESQKENEFMSKALLHQWGREEVGIASPQEYRYKFPARKAGVPTGS